MDYVGNIFRPPSEAWSLLLQVTVGCSHNRCTFCSMYREKSFAVKPWGQIESDLEEAARYGPRFDKVFLCDGDALILSTQRLLRVLEAIREKLPWVRRVGVYGDTRSVLPKRTDELAALREAGLGIVYHGLESGDDDVLSRIEKGGTRAEAIEAALRLRQAGITHSVIVLLGVGGTDRSAQHAAGTATALTAMDPRYASALTVTIVPGTPIWHAHREGRFTLPDKFALLGELRAIVAGSRFTECRFSCNHASNYLPLRGDMPKDRDGLLAILDRVIEARDERLLKPEHLRGL